MYSEKFKTILELFQQYVSSTDDILKQDLKLIVQGYINQCILAQDESIKSFMFVTSDGITFDENDVPTEHEQLLGIANGIDSEQALENLIKINGLLSREAYYNVDAYRLYKNPNKITDLIVPDQFLTLEANDVTTTFLYDEGSQCKNCEHSICEGSDLFCIEYNKIVKYNENQCKLFVMHKY